MPLVITGRELLQHSLLSKCEGGEEGKDCQDGEDHGDKIDSLKSQNNW